MMIEELELVIERIKKRTEIDPITNCWLWQGGKCNGYGTITFRYRIIKIHRLSAAYYLQLNLADPSQQANHKIECNNKHCWNPKHLYIGTEFENKQDRIVKNEEARGVNQHTGKLTCIRGHDISTPDKYYKYGNKGRRCKECEKMRYRREI